LKRFLTRAEAMTLLGMIACIASLFFKWPAPINTPLPPAIHIDLTLLGQSISGVNWPMKICAIASGATLMFTTNAKTRLPLAVFQGLCGLVCFVISLTHFAPIAGPLTGLFGGGLLTFGAVDRYTQSTPQERSTISEKSA
jgi:hypothetical protein